MSRSTWIRSSSGCTSEGARRAWSAAGSCPGCLGHAALDAGRWRRCGRPAIFPTRYAWSPGALDMDQIGRGGDGHRRGGRQPVRVISPPRRPLNKSDGGSGQHPVPGPKRPAGSERLIAHLSFTQNSSTYPNVSGHTPAKESSCSGSGNPDRCQATYSVQNARRPALDAGDKRADAPARSSGSGQPGTCLLRILPPRIALRRRSTRAAKRTSVTGEGGSRPA